jgi:pimeloyl-ACP methyl ester carboxylesterase
VRLARPLVICPGWNTEHYKFRHLAHKLAASGQNGEPVYLKQGQAFSDSTCTQPLALEQIPSNSKVFINIWDSVKSAPHQTAPQIAQNLELVHAIAGPGPVDMIGYSMGGLAARKYLDNGGSDVGRLMTLGSPHQGTRFAQMAQRVVERDVQWAENFAGLGEEDKAPLAWLAAGRPTLTDFNSRWPQHEALTVAGRSEMTPALGWLPFRKGDGMVDPSRSTLPDTPSVVLERSTFLHHGSLPHDSKVYQTMSQFFGFEAVPGDYQPLPPIVLNDHHFDTPYGEL